MNPIDLSNLSSQLFHGISNKKLSKADLQVGSSLDVISDQLTTRVINDYSFDTSHKEYLTQEEFLTHTVDKLSVLIGSPEYQGMLSEIDKAANIIYAHLQQLNSKLKNEIAPAVESLTNDILQERDKNLVSMGAEVLLDTLKHHNDSATFQVLDWKGIDTLNGKDCILDHIRHLTNMSIPEASKHIETYVISKLSPVKHTIQMDDIDKKNLIANIYKYTKLPKDKVEVYLSLILDPTQFDQEVKPLVMNWTSVSPSINTPQYDTFICYMKPMLDVISKTNVFLSNEVRDKYNENIANMKDICYALGSYLVYHRENTFKNALVMTDDVINGDNINEFEEQEGGIQDIVDHVRMMYKIPSTIIPMSGIPTKDVLEQKKEVAASLEKYHQDIKAKSSAYVQAATTKAFMYVVHNYAKTKSTDKDKNLSDVAYYNLVNSNISNSLNILNGRDNSIEDAIYTFMIEMYHKNTPLNDIYSSYKKEIVAALESHSAVDKSLSAWLDYRVATTWLSRALVDNYVV